MADHVLDQVVLVLRHHAAQQARKLRVEELLVLVRERVLLRHRLDGRGGRLRRQLHLILMLRRWREGKQNLMRLEQMLAERVGVGEDFVARRARILDLRHDGGDGVRLNGCRWRVRRVVHGG